MVQVPEGREYVEKTVEITLGSASEHQSSGGWSDGFRPGGRP